MAKPSSNRLTKAYQSAQIDRVLATLEKIIARPQPSTVGRVIPATENLTIHDGKRLEATVMFLDISKFSNRPCESAEEQLAMMQILSLFFTEMIRIVEDHGGVVEKNTGDGLMAYFAQNNEPEISIQHRAMSCALTMFSAAETIINPVLVRSQIDPLQFRVCLDHGHITIAKVGVARQFNGIVAIGTTANIASKMLAVAKPNTILIGDSMLKGLPQEWNNRFVSIETSETGWVYRELMIPYPFYRYTGRWTIPTV